MEFTGISSPYEDTEFPDLVIDTAKLFADQAILQLISIAIIK